MLPHLNEGFSEPSTLKKILSNAHAVACRPLVVLVQLVYVLVIDIAFDLTLFTLYYVAII